MTDWIVIPVILGLLAVLVGIGVRRRWFTQPRGSFTGITVYHDMINQDAQRQIEIIIERNAGRKEDDDDSGEPGFDDQTMPTEQET